MTARLKRAKLMKKIAEKPPNRVVPKLKVIFKNNYFLKNMPPQILMKMKYDGLITCPNTPALSFDCIFAYKRPQLKKKFETPYVL